MTVGRKIFMLQFQYAFAMLVVKMWSEPHLIFYRMLEPVLNHVRLVQAAAKLSHISEENV